MSATIMSGDTWVYKQGEEPKLVTWDEADELYEHGWVDTPAKFNNSTSKEDLDIPSPVSELLEGMTKVEIEEYGRDQGIELDRRKTKANMIADLEAYLES